MLPPAITPPAVERAHAVAAPADDAELKPIEPGQYLGQAVLRESGEIVVTLDDRFLHHEGVLHTSYRYDPGTKGYEEVIANLGPFKPGEYKKVYARGMWAP